MTGFAERVERVVRRAIAAAVSAARAPGIVVLDDWTPEGELACEWLVRELGAGQVWRVASLASNVQEVPAGPDAQLVAASRAVTERGALLAHPANRTALLLGGALPRADLFPFGDVPATQMQVLTGSWTAPADVVQLAGAAGGIAALDTALGRWLDDRQDRASAFGELDRAVALRVVDMYERGRYSRLRPRLVPKLGARTIGIDLFD